MDNERKRKNLLANMIVEENDHWLIMLGPESVKCGWLNLNIILKCDPSVIYNVSFNQVYRKTDNGEGWNRLLDEHPEVGSWFFDSVDLRFPFCQFCKEMWEKSGCVFDDV